MSVLAGALSGLGWQRLTDSFVLSNTFLGLCLALAGYPIARARTANPIGWLLLAGGCCYALSGTGYAVLAWGTSPGADGPGWRLLATVMNGSWPLAAFFVVPVVLLLFPDGRLPKGRYWRVPVVAAGIATGILVAQGVSSARTLSGELGVSGYLTWATIDDRSWLGGVVTGGALIVFGSAVVALFLRYRRGDDRQRRQVLWLLFATALVIIASVIDTVLAAESLASVLVIALIPLAIAIAILRYQLVDIRLVVSRSLAYLVLTAAVVGGYVAIVTVTDRTLSRRLPLGPPVLATALLAIGFNPVRRRLQGLVDRLLYGARHDPVRAVAELGARLGEVEGDLNGLLEIICRAMRLPSATLMADGAAIAQYGPLVAIGNWTAIPLRLGGDVVGELRVSWRVGEQRLDRTDGRVLALLTSSLAVAVRATVLADDLRDARTALVTAREEERRRLRRDLHDGIGPVLTGVILQADAARRLTDSDPAQAAVLMGSVRRQTTAAVDEIRRLVNELRPPALDVLGLVGALEEQAATLGRRTDGEELQVRIAADRSLNGLPAAVEVALYRIATEALTNVVRHSSASVAEVSLRLTAANLVLTVSDNGSNGAGAWPPGVGLTSMGERAAELGGTFRAGPGVRGGSVEVTVPRGGPG